MTKADSLLSKRSRTDRGQVADLNALDREAEFILPSLAGPSSFVDRLEPKAQETLAENR